MRFLAISRGVNSRSLKRGNGKKAGTDGEDQIDLCWTTFQKFRICFERNAGNFSCSYRSDIFRPGSLHISFSQSFRLKETRGSRSFVNESAADASREFRSWMELKKFYGRKNQN